MATTEEYAALSTYVYGGKPLPSGWEAARRASGEAIQLSRRQGYHGAVLRRSGTDEYALVSRGTEWTDPGDWAADRAMFAGKVPVAQLEDARQLLGDALASGVPRDGLTLVGHSLGGSLSQLLAALEGIPAVTFNAFPVGRLLPQLGLDPDARYPITDIVERGDLSSHLGPHVGTRLKYGHDELPASLAASPQSPELLDIHAWARCAYASHAIDGVLARIRDARSVLGPCPLVLDLDGDGVETVGLGAAAYFDHDGDGFAELTGWVGPDDGLLVWDRDGNGVIDSGRELFGNHTVLPDGRAAANGYEALAALDANRDGRLDALDPAFGSLRAWRDRDGDGRSRPGELRSLAEVGVTAIATAFASSATVDAQGNAHRQVSTFVRSDGTVGGTADVWFAVDRARTVAADWVTVPAEIAALPGAPGLGSVRDLHQAMAADETGTLTQLVRAFAAEPSPAARTLLVEPLLFAWTGTAGIDPASRGTQIDARQLAVLEKFSGEPWVGAGGARDPNVNAAPLLREAFRDLVEVVHGTLMAQSHLARLDRLIAYRWNEPAGRVEGDLSDVADALRGRLATDPEGGTAELAAFGRMVRGRGLETALGYWEFREGLVAGREDLGWALDAHGKRQLEGGATADSLTGGEAADAIRGHEGDDTLRGEGGADVLYGGPGHDILSGGGGDDLLVGGEGDDQLFGGPGRDRLEGGPGADRLYGDAGPDTLVGGAGDDFLWGGDGPDVLDGGPGDDWLEGGFGDDTYLFGRGAGQDTVNDRDWQVPNVDRIVLAPDVSPAAVRVERSGHDLVLRIRGSADEMRVLGWFLEGFGAEYQVQRVEFANGTVWDVPALKRMAETPAPPVTVTEEADGRTAWSTVSHTLGAGVKNLVLIGTAAIDGAGNKLDNKLTGNRAANVLDGLAGADVMAGGRGDDTYIVDHPRDRVIEAPGEGRDTVRSSVSYTLPPDVERLVLTGSAAIGGTGNALDNELAGNAAANVLEGGLGADILAGGAGNDTYRFAPGWGRDVIAENDATPGNRDLARFTGGIRPMDLIFARDRDDLRISLRGAGDSVAIGGWYRSSAHHVEVIRTDGRDLLSAQVDRLIQAMAGLTRRTGLDWERAIEERPEDVQAVLAAYWQPSAAP